MINEIHAAITLRPLSTSGLNFWEDYVDPQWYIPQALPQAALDLRQVLVTSPDIPEACAWRAYQLRSLVESTDFTDVRLLFDQREGYYPPDIIRSMTAAFSPLLTSELTNLQLTFNKKLTAPTYQLYRYKVTGSSGDVVLTSTKYGSSSGVWDTNEFAQVVLPGTDVTMTIQPFVGTGVLDIAARPEIGLPEVSQRLTELQYTVLDQMVKLDSVINEPTRILLARVAASPNEIGAQLAAATLLLAGCVKAHVVK